MKIAKLKSFVPELFLIASVFYYWTLTSNLFNPYALILLGILVYQISKKATLGLIISAFVICLTLFMVLALISELSEFDAINESFNKLLIFGSLYLGFTLVMAGLMFYKNLKLKIN